MLVGAADVRHANTTSTQQNDVIGCCHSPPLTTTTLFFHALLAVFLRTLPSQAWYCKVFFHALPPEMASLVLHTLASGAAHSFPSHATSHLYFTFSLHALFTVFFCIFSSKEMFLFFYVTLAPEATHFLTLLSEATHLSFSLSEVTKGFPSFTPFTQYSDFLHALQGQRGVFPSHTPSTKHHFPSLPAGPQTVFFHTVSPDGNTHCSTSLLHQFVLLRSLSHTKIYTQGHFSRVMTARHNLNTHKKWKAGPPSELVSGSSWVCPTLTYGLPTAHTRIPRTQLGLLFLTLLLYVQKHTSKTKINQELNINASSEGQHLRGQASTFDQHQHPRS